MNYIRYPVVKEYMDYFLSIPYSQACDEFIDRYVDRNLVLGYGVYNVVFLPDEGYVQISVGSSCD